MKILSKYGLIILLILNSFFSKSNCNEDVASNWTDNAFSVSKELFLYIRKVLPDGRTMLELGSGWASEQFSKFYNLYSIEHDEKWLDKYETNYIYVPIKNKWYDPKILEELLPDKYDLILVDGPPGPIGRYGFCTYLKLFKTDLIIIFDDVERKRELKLLLDTAKKLGRKYTIYKDSFGKKFGVIDNRK